MTFLAKARREWDAVFSNWGAAFFIDPEILLPLILPRLAPGGVLAFSSVEPLDPCYGPQVVYANGYRDGAWRSFDGCSPRLSGSTRSSGTDSWTSM